MHLIAYFIDFGADWITLSNPINLVSEFIVMFNGSEMNCK